LLFGFQAINGSGSKSQLGCHYQKVYENGVKLTKKEMELYENRIFRVSLLPKWDVTITHSKWVGLLSPLVLQL